MSLFDRLKATLAAKGSTSVRLTGALEEARQVADGAAAEVAELEAKRRELLTAPEADRARHKAALAAAGDRLADGQLFIEEITAKLDAARGREAEAERRKAYARAQRMAAEAKARLEAEYPDLADRFLSLLHQVTEAQRVVGEVNEDLPEGSRRLADPEAELRDRPTLLREVLAERVVERWVVPSPFRVLSRLEGMKVRATGERRGVIEVNDSSRDVELRKLRWMRYLDHEQGFPGPRLRSMGFPGLRHGEEPFWPGASTLVPPRDVLSSLERSGEQRSRSTGVELHRPRVEAWLECADDAEPDAEDDLESSLEGES